jgi:hypothetical protein
MRFWLHPLLGLLGSDSERTIPDNLGCRAYGKIDNYRNKYLSGVNWTTLEKSVTANY